MVGRFLILWLLAVTPVVCADQTSLMQGMKLKSQLQVTSKPSRRAYLDDLLERTETILKSGVTPDVVTFAQSTMDMITNTIVPVISEEHATDQHMLHSLWKGFVVAENDFVAGVAEIQALINTHQDRSRKHMECRDLESDLCAEANQCDAELGELWKVVVDLEKQIADVDIEIFTDYCEGNENRTESSFRTDQVVSFTEYIRLKELLDEAWAEYYQKLSECRRKRQLHHDKIEVCISKQTSLEEATCESAVKTDSVRDQYVAAFGQAKTAYETAVAGIRIEEADRKVEFSTLQMILCLLDNINEMVNGSAAAAGTDYHSHLEACHGTIYDTEHLDMLYNETPPMLELPVIPNYPCTADYLRQEYGDMPFCTQAETCVQCAGMTDCEQTPCTKDLCSDGLGRRQIGDECCQCPEPVCLCFASCWDGSSPQQIGDECCVCPEEPPIACDCFASCWDGSPPQNIGGECCVCPEESPVNLLVNGGFDEQEQNRWEFTAPHGWEAEDIDWGAYNHPGHCQGFTCADSGLNLLDLCGKNQGWLQQTVSVTPHEMYGLNFQMSGHQGCGGVSKEVTVTMNDESQSFTHQRSGDWARMNWDTHSMTTLAKSDSLTIRFTTSDRACGCALLDSVSLVRMID